MTLQGTNTYLVGTGTSRLLVDSGEGGKEEWREGLQGVLQVLVPSRLVLLNILSDHPRKKNAGLRDFSSPIGTMITLVGSRKC